MMQKVGDVDFLVISNKPEEVMDFFVSMPEVINVYSKGKTRSSIKLKIGMNAGMDTLGMAGFILAGILCIGWVLRLIF